MIRLFHFFSMWSLFLHLGLHATVSFHHNKAGDGLGFSFNFWRPGAYPIMRRMCS